MFYARCIVQIIIFLVLSKVAASQCPNPPNANNNGPFCETGGTVLKLTASDIIGAAYKWTGPNGFTSDLQNPTINNLAFVDTGDYFVTATVNGCTSAASVTHVSIIPTPPTPIAGSNGPYICEGLTVKLTASDIPNSTYQWYGPNNFSSTLQNPVIDNFSTIHTGTYNVVAKRNGCGSLHSIVTVYMQEYPVVLSVNNSPLCVGQTLSLTTTEILNATYAWTGPNGFTSSLRNPVIGNVSLANAGLYTVIASKNGCTGNPDTTTVIVKPNPATPVINTNSPLCTGNSLNLTTPLIPGGIYNWTGPGGFTSSVQNPSISNINLLNAGNYYLNVIDNGCINVAPGLATVLIDSTPPTPIATSNGPLCVGTTLNLSTTNIAGVTYTWTGPNGFTSTLRNPVISNVNLANAGLYTITASKNGCTSPPDTINVIVTSTPGKPVINTNSPLCTGNSLNLTTPFIQGGIYNWTGPGGFTSSVQNPSINNIKLANAGNYYLNVIENGCINVSPGIATVIIDSTPPNPIATSNGPLCVGSTLNLFATYIAGVTYNWSGPNGFTSSLQNPAINNVNLSQGGAYSVTASFNNCSSLVSTVMVSVSSVATTPVITTNSPVCEGNTITLSTPYYPGISYTWTGPNGFTSSIPNPVIPNAGMINSGDYTVTLSGCNISSNTVAVVINLLPATPTTTNNGPLCLGQALNLNAATITGATYAWSGPNGFISSLQNPVLNNVSFLNSGVYTVIATVNNCPGKPGSTIAVVQDSARAIAGNDQMVCADNNVVNIAGAVTGGSTSGIWSTSGSGTFSPANTSLITSYNLTSADKATGNVILTLTSANNGVCPASVSSMRITIPAAITVNAGSDQTICESDSSILLNGQVIAALSGRWSTSGTGSFFPNNLSINPVYIPSNSDKNLGSVVLTLTSTGNGNCAAVSDQVLLTINRGPLVNAGPDRVVKENETIILDPIITGSNLRYLWTPNLYLSNDTVKSPAVTGVNDQVYTLTVSDGNGCKKSDKVSVTILRIPNIPNTFTPNNDGINDIWIIKNLVTFPDCKVQVFNRYGQIVFESKGYSRPWDGTLKGKSLPLGTYYYVIEPGSGISPVTGYVTLIK